MKVYMELVTTRHTKKWHNTSQQAYRKVIYKKTRVKQDRDSVDIYG
jgi:hypothetical protein